MAMNVILAALVATALLGVGFSAADLAVDEADIAGEENMEYPDDLEDRRAERRDHLREMMMNDLDSDGIANCEDPDDDGDGINDAQDEYPHDHDNDEIPDWEDDDDDNDGIPDDEDDEYVGNATRPPKPPHHGPKGPRGEKGEGGPGGEREGERPPRGEGPGRQGGPRQSGFPDLNDYVPDDAPVQEFVGQIASFF